MTAGKAVFAVTGDVAGLDGLANEQAVAREIARVCCRVRRAY